MPVMRARCDAAAQPKARLSVCIGRCAHVRRAASQQRAQREQADASGGQAAGAPATAHARRAFAWRGRALYAMWGRPGRAAAAGLYVGTRMYPSPGWWVFVSCRASRAPRTHAQAGIGKTGEPLLGGIAQPGIVKAVATEGGRAWGRPGSSAGLDGGGREARAPPRRAPAGARESAGRPAGVRKSAAARARRPPAKCEGAGLDARPAVGAANPAAQAPRRRRCLAPGREGVPAEEQAASGARRRRAVPQCPRICQGSDGSPIGRRPARRARRAARAAPRFGRRRRAGAALRGAARAAAGGGCCAVGAKTWRALGAGSELNPGPNRLGRALGPAARRPALAHAGGRRGEWTIQNLWSGRAGRARPRGARVRARGAGRPRLQGLGRPRRAARARRRLANGRGPARARREARPPEHTCRSVIATNLTAAWDARGRGRLSAGGPRSIGAGPAPPPLSVAAAMGFVV